MFYIITRGPAGVGKSTIAKILAEKLNAYYISFDDILSKHKLDTIEGDGISAKNFIRGNELAIDLIQQVKPKIIVFDGCFYREEQMNHLIKNLRKKHFIFTLKADLNECIKRNHERGNPISKQAVKDVHKLVSKRDGDTIIDTSGKTINQIVEEILNYFPLTKQFN